MSKQGKRPPVSSRKVAGSGAGAARSQPDRGPAASSKPAPVGRPVASGKAARSGSSGSTPRPSRPQTARRSPKGRRPLPGKSPVYRQRRFPPLPVWLKVALAVGWLAAAALTFWLVDSWTARIGFLVVATMLLPLVVVLVRDPTRRTR
jgi:hypothetical protein